MRRRGRPPKRSSGGRPEGSDQPELPSPSRQTEDPSILSGRSSLSQAQSDSLLSDSTVPFFNTTLFTYRVSPLHLGDNPLTPGRLQVLSQRLRDTVVGDVVRGVEVGLVGDDTSMPRAGVLQFVDVRWVNLGTILGLDPAGSSSRSPSQDLGSDGAEPISSAKDPGDPAVRERVGKIALRRRALLFSLRYENAFYTALLVPPLVEDTTPLDIQGKPLNEDRFVALPLLLLRMPAPLRPIIVDFLSTNFDCRISPLRFGTRTLVTSLERWMATTGLAASESAAKDVVLTLGFSLPAPGTPDSETEEARPGNPGLKSLEVTISAAELDAFHSTGTRLQKSFDSAGSGGSLKRKRGWEGDPARRRKFAGQLYEEGWGWRTADQKHGRARNTTDEHPFTEALGYYLDQHLALDLFHPMVRITKIACGGFFMAQGKVKILPPTSDRARAGDGRGGRSAVLASAELVALFLDKAMVHRIEWPG